MSPRTVTPRPPVAVPLVETGFPFRLDDVRSRSAALAEPVWLLERRVRAWEAFQRLPFPSTTEEAWRRTDLRPMPRASLALGAASGPEVDPELLQPLAGEAHGALLSLTPGLEPLRDGGKDLARRDVVFTDWASAVRDHASRIEAAIGQAVADDEDSFTALAASLAVDGVVVFVPAGVHVAQPLHSVFWAPGDGRAFFSRVLVVVEDGASVTFVHETASPTDLGSCALHTGITEIVLGAAARLTFVELQTWGDHVWNVTHERAIVGREGRLDWIFGAVGSRLTKTFSELNLTGQGAEGRMSGLYFADGSQHLDHDTQQNHLAPHTTSDLLFKGALLGRSRSVWQGMVYVAPGAQKADGYQANRNLMLSQHARADSIPGLEILADDVRCTHGATVGQLEDEPVYYLMSRGLPRREAERMVVHGFFAPIMDRIPFDGVRGRFGRLIDAKLTASEMRG
jgi:Fe-S cluster assembly protein SufD